MSAFSAAADEQEGDQNGGYYNDYENFTLAKQYSKHCDSVSRFVQSEFFTQTGRFQFLDTDTRSAYPYNPFLSTWSYKFEVCSTSG